MIMKSDAASNDQNKIEMISEIFRFTFGIKTLFCYLIQNKCNIKSEAV